MLAITPEVLRAMYGKLDLSANVNLAFWAACLVGFFTFFRKSTLLPASVVYNRADLSRSDVTFNSDNIVIHVKHTKTIQFSERTLHVPVPIVPDCILCPVAAVNNLWKASPHIPPSAPMFSYPLPARKYSVLTQATFVSMLRNTLSLCGFQSARYSGHSFRRGGATFALASGIPVEIIKSQGDWKSAAVERYLAPSLAQRQLLAKSMSNVLLS